MKSHFLTIFLGILILAACSPTPTTTPDAELPEVNNSDPITPTPMPEPLPEGRDIIVTSPDDSGPGTLRQALEDAKDYDTITFDPAVFPPDEPVTLFINSELPHIRVSHLTLDASNAGVILDGINVSGGWVHGLQIVSVNNVRILGLQFTHFSVGIAISGDSAENNIIGGDPGVGDGPSCQGNIFVNNGTGLDIGSPGTMLNTIKGNLIGTDGSQNEGFGNFGSGIRIWERSHDNTIGPDNIIAYNGGRGIYILGQDAVQNTITQNSIHDNGGFAIIIDWQLRQNFRVPTPMILEFDLQNGKISGTACAGCIVEIFSDDEREGTVYEGTTTTDSNGVFAFEKNAPFAGPNLTTTATDPDGNTSVFSPIAGSVNDLILQGGNDFPREPLVLKPSQELANNRVGLNWGDVMYPDDWWQSTVKQFNEWGIKRADMGYSEKEWPVDWSTGSELVIAPGFDLFIDGLNEIGVDMDLQLHFYDKEGHANSEPLATPRFQDQEQIDDFLEFVRTVVRHFKGRIPYYTIWTEPGACDGGGIKCIMIEDYIELARQVIPVIREEDPDAKIVTAPFVLYFAREEMFTLLRSDVISEFDVISWHPIYDAAPNVEFFGNYYYEYPSIIQDIKDTASANGFNGEYWGTDLSWNSEELCNYEGCRGEGQTWSIQETNLQVAKYFARGIVLELGMDVSPGVEAMMQDRPWSLPTLRNLNNVLAGVVPIDLTVDVENSARFTLRSTFSLPDGSYLIGLWTNGAAVDYDPGIESTVTIPGVSSSKVVAIDVIHGFEQELIFEIVDDDLMIYNLLVKDYPILIKLIDSSK